nr:DUF2142 domain-containing protein [Propionibacterium sp.]
MSARARTALVSLALALASFLALLAWGLSSPVGSAPDDDFHLASMWCPPPIEQSGCELFYEQGRVAGVYVPELVGRPNCFAFRPRVTGACQESLSTTALVTTVRVDQGEYPGPYYRFAHLFVGDNIHASVLGLRAFNAALAVVLIGAAALLTQWRLRSGLAWAIGAAIVPMAMFLVPSVNPSSWAFSGLTAFWISCFALARSTTTRHRLAAAAVAITGAVVALVARNDSFLYVVLALAATTVLYAPIPGQRTGADRRTVARGVLPWVAVAGVALGVGLWSFLTAASSTGILPDESRATRDPWAVFSYNLLESLQMPVGLLGFAQLGWNDVRPPALVYVTSIAITSFVLLTGMRELSPRKLLAVVGVGGTFVVLPIVMLQRALAYVGDQVQARYFMSVLPLLIGVALLSGDGRRALRFGRIQSVFVWGGLTMANSVMLLLNIRRYSVGTAGTYFPGPDADWWWPVGPSPLGLWAIGTIAFALGSLVLVLASGGTGYRRDLVGTVPVRGAAAGAIGPRTAPGAEASEY